MCRSDPRHPEGSAKGAGLKKRSLRSLRLKVRSLRDAGERHVPAARDPLQAARLSKGAAEPYRSLL